MKVKITYPKHFLSQRTARNQKMKAVVFDVDEGSSFNEGLFHVNSVEIGNQDVRHQGPSGKTHQLVRNLDLKEVKTFLSEDVSAEIKGLFVQT